MPGAAPTGAGLGPLRRAQPLVQNQGSFSVLGNPRPTLGKGMFGGHPQTPALAGH
jgi:hypothetical protein